MSLLKKEQENKSSIVIYFSHTGENYMSDGVRNIDKGNTEIVAEFIHDIAGSDLFKVETVNKYPYNYQECCDIAKKELNENARPKLISELNSIDNYDLVYIGSPIWWGHIPMSMFTALEKLNFKGKIVKLFITHEGSGLGSCPKDIEKLCKGANIKESLAIRGSDVYNSKDIVKGWMEK